MRRGCVTGIRDLDISRLFLSSLAQVLGEGSTVRTSIEVTS
jgi:hypothetical protein